MGTSKDWAQDPFTATADDMAPLMNHPHYSLPQSHTVVCEGRLLLAGSESAPTFSGYLEGALEAADLCAALHFDLHHVPLPPLQTGEGIAQGQEADLLIATTPSHLPNDLRRDCP